MNKGFFLIVFLFPIAFLKAQVPEFNYIPAEINFNEPILEWDGFGFNYVETAQTRDYEKYPQDYGGFSRLNVKQRGEIMELVFGKDGLRVQILKMFLDPFHQSAPGAQFEHEKSTANMRYFVKKGVEMTRERNDDLEIITTLYGPPGWMTLQDSIGGRDLDTEDFTHLCNYVVDWVGYLKKNNFPVKYISLNNEGEDFYRWDFTSGYQRLEKFDYNMYWPPEQVNKMLHTLPGMLEAAGIHDVGVTNGEPSNWTRFYHWGYAHDLVSDPEAFGNLGLITTHGFINGDFRKLSYGLAEGNTTVMSRSLKPDLHCWITSFSWGDMGTDLIKTAQEQIYTAGANALIPWAGIQQPSQWYDGDPNPGCAIQVHDDGTYTIMQGYYFYKQLTQAGRRGMAVVRTTLSNPVAFIIAFGKNGTKNPDSFIITSNIRIWSLPVKIHINGTESKRFSAFRTSEDGKEKFSPIGVYDIREGSIIYDPPAGTTTTFIGLD